LLPDSILIDQGSPTERFQTKHDVAHVARTWLDHLDALPSNAKAHPLVARLTEVIARTDRRGHAGGLSEDLHSLSEQDADAAHDSLGLVRIIAWAIPMLGFLGTVIGITQTLGGLDFSSGSAAVENLKSGLYVAFDTTALGLVLSVIAIFSQWPVERAEQRFWRMIDTRVETLVSAHLPTNDEQRDDYRATIIELCQGVQTAVAQSIETQTELWSRTIAQAQEHWQNNHRRQSETIAKSFEASLVPALIENTRSLKSTNSNLQQVDHLAEVLQQTSTALSKATQHSGDAIERSMMIRSSRDETVSDAVRTLARAVDILCKHLPPSTVGQTGSSSANRKAA
ncbi:MAG: MotA/TolQ/ExbB proton channel family protein, partial [Planctomycetota bacterium]